MKNNNVRLHKIMGNVNDRSAWVAVDIPSPIISANPMTPPAQDEGGMTG